MCFYCSDTFFVRIKPLIGMKKSRETPGTSDSAHDLCVSAKRGRWAWRLPDAISDPGIVGSFQSGENTMTTKLILLASALLGLSLNAMAGQPITLNDSQMDSATAGDGFFSDTFIRKRFVIDESIRDDKLARYDVTTRVLGQSAVAQAEADAEGSNADAQTFTFAQITPNKVGSASKSIALRSCGCF
jgi:hypothetical protein